MSANRWALDEHEAKQLLARYGVPVVEEARVADAQQAVIAAERIGFPVVLKACDSRFAHKTEWGLVHLNLRDAEQVRDAAEQVVAAMHRQATGHLPARDDARVPSTPLDQASLLVQQQVAGRREFLIGMTRDAQFGPVVTFGLGGIFAEALADVALRVCPISSADAVAMQGEIRASALLGPWRGMPAVDQGLLARSIEGVARLAQEHPEIDAIDINPLIIDGARPVAVDALILRRPVP